MEPDINQKTIAILQSNYIPWKGYFDIINSVDEFVIYDEVQYTKRDWRNRNRIKTKDGLKWLTIPVEVKGKYNQKISEVKLAEAKWPLKHWKTIEQNYRSARYFKDYEYQFFKAFEYCQKLNYLKDVNRLFIDLIISVLGIKTKILNSSDYILEGNKNIKIISICKQLGADVYLTGPSAGSYLEEELFRESGITVKWMDYSGYTEYHQLYTSFEHRVSILDLIFNEGENSNLYMKSFR